MLNLNVSGETSETFSTPKTIGIRYVLRFRKCCDTLFRFFCAIFLFSCGLTLYRSLQIFFLINVANQNRTNDAMMQITYLANTLELPL